MNTQRAIGKMLSHGGSPFAIALPTSLRHCLLRDNTSDKSEPRDMDCVDIIATAFAFGERKKFAKKSRAFCG